MELAKETKQEYKEFFGQDEVQYYVRAEKFDEVYEQFISYFNLYNATNRAEETCRFSEFLYSVFGNKLFTWLTEIPAGMFWESKELSGDIELPDNIKRIGDFAFYNCSQLKSITITGNVVKIGGSAFYKCENLQSVKVQGVVTGIGDFAFEGCHKLKKIKIPYGVTEIGENAFPQDMTI